MGNPTGPRGPIEVKGLSLRKQPMLIITLLIVFIVQAPAEIFDVVVTDVEEDAVAVTWGPTSKLRISGQGWARARYAQWPDRVVKGQLLKATFDAKGKLVSVADCETRKKQMDIEYCGGVYCQPPAQLRPPDCSRATAPFITELLRKMDK